MDKSSNARALKLNQGFWQGLFLKDATDIKKDPVVTTVEPKSETVNEKAENDANKNNGNHTPV